MNVLILELIEYILMIKLVIYFLELITAFDSNYMYSTFKISSKMCFNDVLHFSKRFISGLVRCFYITLR